jgi:hypothetical protein
MLQNLRNPLEEAAMVEVIARVAIVEAAAIKVEIVVEVEEQEEIITIQQQKSQVHHLRHRHQHVNKDQLHQNVQARQDHH